MNLRQIEIFQAVFAAGTASKAAVLLNLSQPAVSKAVQDLERSIGFVLFDRSTGRMVPTAEGELFHREVEQTFAGLSRLRSSAARIRDFGSGEIRLASLSALSTNIVPKAIAAFRQRHPQVAITFQTQMSSTIRDLVAAGQFDIGLTSDEVDTTGVTVEPFAIYRAAIALPEGHHLCAKPVLSPLDLHGEAFVALAPEDRTRQKLETLLAAAGAVPRIVLETPYSTTVCAMVQAGIGCGLINPLNAEPFLGRGLTWRPFEPALYFCTLLLTPPGRRSSRIAEDARTLLQSFAGEKPMQPADLVAHPEGEPADQGP